MEFYDSNASSTEGVQPISYTRLIEVQMLEQIQAIARNFPHLELSQNHNCLQVCTGLETARGAQTYSENHNIKRQMALNMDMPISNSQPDVDEQQTALTKRNRLQSGISCYGARQSLMSHREDSQRARHQLKDRQASLPLGKTFRQTVLKSIQENELEYKKSDESQRSIGNKIFRSNLQSSDQINPSKPQARSHQLLAKKNQTLNPSSLENPCIRQINDSLQIEAHNEQLGFEDGGNRQADRLTLRLVPEVNKKSALLSQSPQGRGILSSLVTSKRQQQDQRRYKHKKIEEDKQRSALQLILSKIECLESLVSQVKERRRQTQRQRRRLQIQRQIKAQGGIQEYRKFENARNILIQHPQRTIYQPTEEISFLEQILKSPVWKQFHRLSWKTSEQAVRFLTQILDVLVIRVDSIRNVQFVQKQLVAQLLPTRYHVTLHPDYLYIRLSSDSQGQFTREVGIEVKPMQYAYSGSFIVRNINSKKNQPIKQGQGSVVYLDSYYQGGWYEGNYHGKGLFHSPDGNLYVGTFFNGLKEGYGQEFFANGDQYSGYFSNNLYEGRGKYKWGSGSMYVGDFHEGLMHGKGIWKSRSQDYYNGQFRKGFKEGWGVYTWKNGCAFRGYFKKGRMATHQPNYSSSVEIMKKNCDETPQLPEDRNGLFQKNLWRKG